MPAKLGLRGQLSLREAFQLPCELAQGALEQSVEQTVLAAEAVLDHRDVDLGPGADLAHRRALAGTLDQQIVGGLQQLGGGLVCSSSRNRWIILQQGLDFQLNVYLV